MLGPSASSLSGTPSESTPPRSETPGGTTASAESVDMPREPRRQAEPTRRDANKNKRIPLNHYEWPEDNIGDQNYKRPITASHGQGRKRDNYDSQRREIQSRGKPIAMGLTGTSQENADGNCKG